MYAFLGLAHRNPPLDLPHSFPPPTKTELQVLREGETTSWKETGLRITTRKAVSIEALCECEGKFHCVKLLKFGGSDFREPLPTDGGLKICFQKGFFFFYPCKRNHTGIFLNCRMTLQRWCDAVSYKVTSGTHGLCPRPAHSGPRSNRVFSKIYALSSRAKTHTVIFVVSSD